ncbi:hypothetical protein [Streptomyces nigra]|uniref:hypothetical protein n=1 Tax=Streptomyces nigra TaxID=1827580 RepID=UPI00343C020D
MRDQLSRQPLEEMRPPPGPDGTLVGEFDGMGVTWMLRPSAQGRRIVQRGGPWPGQISGLMPVPGSGFAPTLPTNSEGGTRLRDELFTDAWALSRYAGAPHLPATALTWRGQELKPYEGRYMAQRINDEGAVEDVVTQLTRENGRLHGTQTAHGPAGQDEPASAEEDSVQESGHRAGSRLLQAGLRLARRRRQPDRHAPRLRTRTPREGALVAQPRKVVPPPDAAVIRRAACVLGARGPEPRAPSSTARVNQ